MVAAVPLVPSHYDDDPPPPSKHLSTLPNLVHHLIGSFLTTIDIHATMLSTRWMHDVYGRHQPHLFLHAPSEGEDGGEGDRVVGDVLTRHPRVVHVKVMGDLPALSLARAIKERITVPVEEDEDSDDDDDKDVGGAATTTTTTTTMAGRAAFHHHHHHPLRHVEELEVCTGREALVALVEVLGERVCPNLMALNLSRSRHRSRQEDGGQDGDDDMVLRCLGQALTSRMMAINKESSGGNNTSSSINKGSSSSSTTSTTTTTTTTTTTCRGLKSLTLMDLDLASTSLAPILSSGACESLEKVHLEGSGGGQAVGQWLTRTTAPYLTSLTLTTTMGSDVTEVVEALCTRGVAGRLQDLVLTNNHNTSVDLDEVRVDQVRRSLTRAIHQHHWPDLTCLKLPSMRIDVPRMVHSLGHVGWYGQLTTLSLTGVGMNVDGVTAVAKALGRGAWPKLEELDLEGAVLGDEGAKVLARGLNHMGVGRSLRRLHLMMCEIGAVGMADLSESLLARGGKSLQVLDVSGNELEDEGVVHLAEAMARGGLPELVDLRVESVELGDGGARALGMALSMGRHKHLRYLYMRGNFLSRRVAVDMGRALEEGRVCMVLDHNLLFHEEEEEDEEDQGGGWLENEQEMDDEEVQRNWEMLAVFPWPQ